MNNKIVAGIGVGFGAYVLYELLPSNVKRVIKESFNIHHGALGVIASALGISTNNPKLIGVGAGLVITDLQDKDEWFNQY